MTTDYRKLYMEDIFTLAKTLVIKSEDSADLINQQLILLYGVPSSTPDDPASWKYYRNLSGEYHETDQLMTVVSLDSVDTVVEIPFTKASLAQNPTTQEAYQYGSRYYTDLVTRYPDQAQLIFGILYPADLQTAIGAENGTILAYVSKYVEPQEATLIKELETWIKHHLTRWRLQEYQITDNLYLVMMHAIMYMNIPSKIFNLRLKRCRTNEVHSFHIRQYLASHQNLDQYLDYLTLAQALFLYRNIAYIEHHPGYQTTFDWLVSRMLTDRQIPIAEYSIRHLATYDDLYRPDILFKKKPLNTAYNIVGPDFYTLDEVLSKEASQKTGNPDYIEDQTTAIQQLIQRSSSSTIQTKILESSAIDYTDGVPYTFPLTLLNYWGYFASQGGYTASITPLLPRETEVTPMSVKTAYLYMLYTAMVMSEETVTTIPAIALQRIQRPGPLTPQDLLAVVDTTYIKDTTEADWLLSHQPVMKQYKTVTSFNDFCVSRYNAGLEEWRYVSNVQHMYRRALVKNMANRLYFDGFLAFPETGQLYSAWLSAMGLSLHEYTYAERLKVIEVLFQAATGYHQDPTKLLKNIQAALIAIMQKLSSYSIQFLREINETPIRPLNWAMTRVGDVSGENGGEWLVSPEVVVFDFQGGTTENRSVMLPNTNSQEIAEVVYETQATLSMQAHLLNEHSYDMTHAIPLSSIVVVADYPDREPNVPYIGMLLTPQQKAEIYAYWSQ